MRLGTSRKGQGKHVHASRAFADPIDTKPIGVALPGDFSPDAGPAVGEPQRSLRRKNRSRRVLPFPVLLLLLLEICRLMPVKIFFVRVTRVPRPRHADARFGERVSTRSFARGQTPHRGLPGNCWKHLASVCSVIKARSRLVHRCGSYESSPPYLPPRKRDARSSSLWETLLDASL